VSSIGRRGDLSAGFAAVASGKAIVLVLATATIVLSILAAAPLGPSLQAAFGGTLSGDHVLRNDPTFAPTDVIDFLREKAPAVSGVSAAAKWAALLILLQQILVAGGIVSVLGRQERIAAADFLAGVRRNAWHNVKCFLLFLLFAGVSIGLWIAVARAVSRKAFENSPPAAAPAFAWRIASILGVLFLYAIFSLLHDFARAARRSDTRVGAWRAYGRARRTLSGRWWRAFGLFLFWLLAGGALLLAGVALEWAAPAVSAVAIFLQILLQIAVLTIRPVVRVAAWGSYLSLYDGALPLPPPAPAVPPPLAPPAPSLALEDRPLI